MDTRIFARIAPLALGLTTMLGTADASADEDRVHMYGPIAYGVSGDYVQTGETYAGAPVYVLETNAMWRLYRRLNGVWYIDFNELDEQWSGTIEVGPNAETPFGGSWQDDGVGSIPTDEVTVARAAYANDTTGTYQFTGQIYNDAPVYAMFDGAYTNSIYRRADGNWYLDFNDVSEDWNGTMNHTTDAPDWPWESTAWNTETISMAAVSQVDVANCADWSELNTGTYVFTGETYNNAPVFEFVSGEYTIHVYQRADYHWYLDYDGIDETWSGTVDHSIDWAYWPWEATFLHGCTMEASEG